MNFKSFRIQKWVLALSLFSSMVFGIHAKSVELNSDSAKASFQADDGRKFWAYVDGPNLLLQRNDLARFYEFPVERNAEFSPKFFGQESAGADIATVGFVKVRISGVNPDELSMFIKWVKSGSHIGALVFDVNGQAYFRPNQKQDLSYVMIKSTSNENDDGSIKSFMKKLILKYQLFGAGSLPNSSGLNVEISKVSGKYFFKIKYQSVNGQQIESEKQPI